MTICYYVINDNLVDMYGHKYVHQDESVWRSVNNSNLRMNSDFIFTVDKNGKHEWIKNRQWGNSPDAPFNEEFLMLVKLSSVDWN